MLRFKNIKLKDGEDREITRHEAKRITGLSDARLSRLRNELPELRRGHNGKSHYGLYSLRMILEYCNSGRMNDKQKTKGKRK